MSRAKKLESQAEVDAENVRLARAYLRDHQYAVEKLDWYERNLHRACPTQRAFIQGRYERAKQIIALSILTQ